jgi:hypothetical protein
MAQNQWNPAWPYGYVPTPTEWNSAFGRKADANAPVLSGAGTLTLTASGDYGFTGTTATWTLPLLSSLTSPFDVKNMGSGNLTVAAAGSDKLYTTSQVSSIVIAAGASAHIVNFGTVWGVE